MSNRLCVFGNGNHIRATMQKILMPILVFITLHSVVLAQNASPAAKVPITELRAAAEKGDAKSQYLLGLRYVEGTEVPKDKIQAYMWLHVAVEQGYLQAMVSRYEVATTMTQDEIAEAKKLAAKIPTAPVARMAAVDSAGETGDRQAIEKLIKNLEDADPSVRKSAVFALGRIKDSWGKGDPQAVRPLTYALGDTDPEVRVAAALALGFLRDPQGKVRLEAVGPLIAALKDADPKVRVAAALALGEIHYTQFEDRQAVGPLIAALKDSNWEVIRAAISGLQLIGSAEAVAPLLALLTVGSMREGVIKSDVQSALTGILMQNKKALGPLIAALKDSNPYVLTEAAKSVGTFQAHLDSQQRKQAIGLLIPALKDSSREVRQSVAWALSSITHQLSFGEDYNKWSSWWAQQRK